MYNKSYLELREQVEERLNTENVVDNGDIISLYTLQNILKEEVSKYNDLLLDDTNMLTKAINRKNIYTRAIKGEIPYIYSISPIVDEEGNRSINVVFSNVDGKYKGDATIDEYFNIKINSINGYSKTKTMKILGKYIVKYIDYMNKLKDFSKEYPNVRCEWNNSYEGMKLRLDDGLLVANFDLENIDRTSFSFSDLNDIILSEQGYKGFLKIDSIITMYNDALLKKHSVNINDLPDLYKSIVQKNIERKNRPGLTRVYVNL